MIRHAPKCLISWVSFTLAAFLALGCGHAKNTPEQALDSLRAAVKDKKWDLLYDILPQDEQKRWDMIVEDMLASNQDQRAQAESFRKAGIDIGTPADMLKQLGLTKDAWIALSQREKFARVFGLEAKLNLAGVGVDPDLVVTAQVRSSTISGDRAEVLIGDKSGHEKKLTFKLQGDYWRFQLSGAEK